MSARILSPLLAVVTTVACALPAAVASTPIEDYPSYQPATRCAPHAKPGTAMLGRWIVRRYGGGFGGISRSCRRHGTSEHHEGRAFDWTVSATKAADRERVRQFLRHLFATDKAGNTDARARRMGVMYVIWNDHMYSAWDGYEAEPYKSSSCRRIRTCSPTLRHRDHVHISLTRKAARGETSWYVSRR
ncbi:hypothetical protein SFC88_18495 [Nocardioides sp. HM23]|uniref:hypothetical protein n=1 Tax=Nocardioides bizhenqiangii TaxID=3095076 RepID=UPI002ACA0F59|nr:hypothetical protein [Nocardioides sp. HM23]MDZ5622835.1 hypothetical protein [Nocardioides sp. HM23]